MIQHNYLDLPQKNGLKFLCDFNDACIVVTGKITATSPNPPGGVNYSRNLAFKSCAPFFSFELRINSQKIDFFDDLNMAIPMFNLLYYSKSLRKTTGFFWNYCPDKPNSTYVGDNARTRIFYPISGSESDDYKTKLLGKLPDGEEELEDIKIVIPLKNLSSFMFNLDILLINVEIELILKWSQYCLLTEEATRTRNTAEAGPPVLHEVAAVNTPSDLKFNITNCKLYVPVVTLQTEYQKKLYEELKTGITIDFTWSKYRSQAINQTATNNLNYLIDPTFNNVNRLFVLAFENEEDRSSFEKYYMPTVEIKDYNVLIDQKPFLKYRSKTKKKLTKQLLKQSKMVIFQQEISLIVNTFAPIIN